jgi:hypothetical protein
MTSSRSPQSAGYRRFKRRRISTLRLTIRIAALTLVATLVIGAGIAWQLSQGADPALGPKAEAAERTQTTTSTSTATSTSTGATSGSTQSTGSSNDYTSSGSSNLTSSYSNSSPAPVTSSAS